LRKFGLTFSLAALLEAVGQGRLPQYIYKDD